MMMYKTGAPAKILNIVLLRAGSYIGGFWYTYAIQRRSETYILNKLSKAIGNRIGRPAPNKNAI